jgi:hypothetical protein
MSYQRYKAGFHGNDGAIRFAAWACYPLADGGSAWRPTTVDYRAVVSYLRPGENFEGESFAYWRAFLEERGGAAVIDMVTDHVNPPCFPCPPEGCPQHPRDDYHDMSRQLEHWSALLRKRGRTRQGGHGRV